ncbi:sulfotransferase family protein [Pseudomonas indica]|uniref:sulfotransferase family protein n=1 Tax=Pseudomonas indica TaxID=137658 RepID=UPI0023F61B9D|nr:sulfotransferase family protein [Pseudomonas indica]
MGDMSMEALRQNETDFHGWLPIRIWPEQGHWWVDWCWFGSEVLCEPFFRDSVQKALRKPFNQALRRLTGIEALLDWQARSPAPAPRAFIHHASRCGSTLIAQLLTQLDSHTVLSEPPPLDAVLRAHFFDPTSAPHQAAWTRALFCAYGQPRRGGDSELVIKLDAWNVFEADFLRALYPQTPAIFLYRDPLEIVVSQLRQPGAHMVPGMIGPSLLAIPAEEAFEVSPLEFAARCIGMILQRGLELCRTGGAIPVNYSELPGAVWGRLAEMLGVPQEAAGRLADAAGRDAKQPGMSFSPDSARKRAEASAETRAAVERWARGPYEGLERLRL